MIRLRMLRMDAGHSIESLGVAAQVAPRAIGNIERRVVEPTRSTLKALALELGWPVKRYAELLEEVK